MLVNLKGDAKITDFGVSAGLDNTMAMVCYFLEIIITIFLLMFFKS
jgi:hypothetical protein